MKTQNTKTVLLSGCSGDFGFLAARALATRGHRVFAGLREPEDRGQLKAQALRQLQSQGLQIFPIELDVDQNESIEGALKFALSQGNGRIDCVISAAGYSVLGPIEACPPEQFLQMLNTNLVGQLRLYRAVLPQMRAQGFGRIVQLTSGLGRAVLPFTGIYASGAWAQECLAESLALEAADFGIEVAILEPAGYRAGGLPRKAVLDEVRLQPYERQLVALSEQLHNPDENPGSSQEKTPLEEVSMAVVHAVEAEKISLRTPVGKDAEALVTLRQQLTADEYEREIRKRAGQTSLE